MGAKSLLKDLGVEVKLVVQSDASAGIAMAEKQGLQRTKHLHTGFLWIQEACKNGDVELQKIDTLRNEADLMTKTLEAPRMRYLLGRMGLK